MVRESRRPRFQKGLRHGGNVKLGDQLAVAIDLGGTKIRVALVDTAGRPVQRVEGLTLSHLGREQTLERLTGMIAELLQATQGRQPVGIGMSLAGAVDPRTGTIYAPPNLPGWDGFSPVPLLQDAFHLPTLVVNDASLAAVGEHVYGVGRGIDNLVYVTVSTGVGGGVIVNGAPMLGAGGYAGEVGHMVIDRNGPLCQCGKRGCLESVASGTAIARVASEMMERRRESLLWAMASNDAAKVGARMVMEAAAQGDGLAEEIMEQFALDLGLGLSNLLNIFDPELLVLGGGVSQNLHLFFPSLIAAIRASMMEHFSQRVPLAFSVLGDDAALLGAAHMAFQAGETP